MTSIFLFCSLQLLALQGSVWGDQAIVNKTTASPVSETTVSESLSSTVSVDELTTINPDNVSHKNIKLDFQLQKDLETLLDELRQVATVIHDVKNEHGQLAKNVAEMSAVVKDMSERNMHIRKKVRKMSKVLNKSTHHHKYKDGLKALQKDHQKILHAMSLRNISLSSLGLKHRDIEVNITEDIDQDNISENLSIPTVNEEPKPTEKEDITMMEKKLKLETSINEESEAANLIPEIVVEPPEGQAVKSIAYPRNCREVLDYGNYTSGVYTIHPQGLPKPIKVWCDQKTEGGGWTVMVARVPSKEQLNFSRDWNDYKYGFGDPSSEHWIGNEALHVMTSEKTNQLRVNITDWNDNEAWADWREFSVASEQKDYKLSVTRYVTSSTAGDALKWHNGMKFSTVDRDNDALMGGHCARTNEGGWWYRGYRGCYQAHPTGIFQNNPENPPETPKGRSFDVGPVLVWQNWRGESYFPKTLFLMFRPVLF